MESKQEESTKKADKALEGAEPTKKAEPFTESEMLCCIEKFGISPLNYSISSGSLSFNGARRIRRAVVRDRIQAVQFSRSQYGSEFSDAITAHLAGEVLVFGEITFKRDTDGSISEMTLENETKLPVDILMSIDYDNYLYIAHLMGKS